MTTWNEISREEACSLLGEGVHTGLRKGSDASDSGTLWRAIFESKTTAWSDALDYAVWGLNEMGYGICRKETE